MSEPRRLLEGSEDELERQLLRAGSRYGASPELREKTLATLGITSAAVGVGAGVALGAAPGAKLGFGSALAKLGTAKVAVLALGATALAAVPVVLLGSSLELSEAVRPPAARPASPVPAVAASSVVVPGGAPVPSVLAAEAPVAPASSARPSASVVSQKASAEALRIELAQLDAARSKLKSGRSEEALALLDAYQRSTPRGALQLEAEVLRIDALSRSGRTDQAKSRARLFLEKHPRSALAARVRHLAGL